MAYLVLIQNDNLPHAINKVKKYLIVERVIEIVKRKKRFEPNYMKRRRKMNIITDRYKEKRRNSSSGNYSNSIPNFVPSIKK
jgi:hypothetical protein